MAAYDFLQGVRVIELAQLGPSSLGGYLADMGAEVIKVEGSEGDPNRFSAAPAVGSPDGDSFLHLRWNRGKKSIGLNLREDKAKEIFKQLVASADIVIEGMKAGALDRLGLGFEVLSEINPKLVFCSLSGLGSYGPYSQYGSHGPSFDAFAGLSASNPYAMTPQERASTDWTAIGMHAMGLYAATGVLAAYAKAQKTGKGTTLEVCGADSAAHWLPDGVNKVLNKDLLYERPGFLNSKQKQTFWPRLYRYETADGRGLFFQALKPKFWQRFCAAIDRLDLVEIYANADDIGVVDEEVYVLLVDIMQKRTLDEWMQLCADHDVPAGPANTLEELANDPHFLARDNTYVVEDPEIGTLKLAGTPVKTPEQSFAPENAPKLWSHTHEVLSEMLGLDKQEMESLREAGIIYSND